VGVKERIPFAVNVVSLRGVPILFLEAISAPSLAVPRRAVAVGAEIAFPAAIDLDT
jgi:hypothetical protein